MRPSSLLKIAMAMLVPKRREKTSWLRTVIRLPVENSNLLMKMQRTKNYFQCRRCVGCLRSNFRSSSMVWLMKSCMQITLRDLTSRQDKMHSISAWRSPVPKKRLSDSSQKRDRFKLSKSNDLVVSKSSQMLYKNE